VLDGLSAVAGGHVRLWRFDGIGLRLAAGADPGWSPPIPREAGLVPTPGGGVWLARIPDVEGFWLETGGADEAEMASTARRLLPALGMLLGETRDRAMLSDELATRYEELDLLFTISEVLGRTTTWDEAAQTVVREVSGVVGARRASIMVHDEAAQLLRTIAARGFVAERFDPIPVDDPCSVAARAFRERALLTYDPSNPDHPPPERCGDDERTYRGRAYLVAPICYSVPGGTMRCLGVLNLTDRIGGDRFTAGDEKLVSAVANQIGIAIENARLVARDRQQQRLRRELELAHDLQLRLLPSPSVLQGDATVAAACVPAEWVGGDFYTFTRLGRGRVGVMLGDVSSHGFSAALIMALVLSAAGIHAGAAVTPDETLTALLDSLRTELETTEMYLTVFYGVVDREGSRLVYANAGHPHAFRIGADGAQRLDATAPPLGLTAAEAIDRRQIPWSAADDLLCLWTDGLQDARVGSGAPFGEPAILDALLRRRTESPDAIVSAVMSEVELFAAGRGDDRTLVVLRL
jgi:sigma-B regulation protein RsbU (phosphoserine phosphatase)